MRLPQLASFFAGVMLAFNLAAQTNTNQTLTVKVQDVSGKPVPGATVEFCSFDVAVDSSLKIGELKAEKTGRDGVVKHAVKREGCQILVHKTGFAIAGQSVYPIDSKPIVLTLGPSQSISGIVVDEQDRLVFNAKVGVESLSFSQGWRYLIFRDTVGRTDRRLDKYLSARTDSNGRFRIEGLAENSAVRLAVNKNGKVLVRARQAYFGPHILPFKAGNQNIRLQLEPAASIEGKMLRPTTNCDLSNVSLSLYREDQEPIAQTKPAADGSFRFDNLAEGTYSILTRFGTNAAPDWVAQTKVLSVESGLASRVTISATKGGILQVATFSQVGHKPMNDAEVYSLRQEFPLIVEPRCLMNDKAVGWMRLSPGRHTLAARKDTAYATATIEIKEGETNRAELELASLPLITGTVRGINGTPVAGTEVKLYSYSEQDTTSTDFGGHFQLKPTEPTAKPLLIARDFDHNLAAAYEKKEGSESCEFKLAPALTLSGRVQDEHGHPVSNAVLNLLLSRGTNQASVYIREPANVDAQGHFQIRALPIGQGYSIDVFAPGYGSASAKIETPKTNNLEIAPITLRHADRKIAGVVLDSSKKPVKGATVMIEDAGQPNNTFANTDLSGRFSISGICEGQVKVIAVVSDGSTTESNGIVRSTTWSNGTVRAQAGDTNIVVTIGQQSSKNP